MNIVLIGSAGRCGIKEYSHILMEGLRALGHQVRYVGVHRHDNRDLARCIRQVKRNEEIAIFEYEPGIFWLGGLVRSMALLRVRWRGRLLLSIHEIGTEKYPEVQCIEKCLTRPLSGSWPGAIVKVLKSTAQMAFCFLKLRIGLLMMGWLPHAILVHSPKAADNIRLAVPDNQKVRYVPHVVKRLDGERDALRQQLGLPLDRFAFIVPGFLFRRKRIIEVIEQLPWGTELWIIGTESEYEKGYLQEIKSYIAASDKQEQVRLIQGYERMEQYLVAADVAVFFYASGYQSGVASLAVGAGKPCIFSDIDAFSDLRDAGLTVHTPAELHEAMISIQDPHIYRNLQERAFGLRDLLAPKQIAAQYLSAVSQGMP